MQVLSNHDLFIPLFSAEHVNAEPEVEAAMQRVLRSRHYILGKEVDGFEKEFAAYLDVEHCVAVANGSDALELALRALGVGPGNTVVTVANAGFYGSFAIHSVGALPLYVDVDASTLTMSEHALERALRQRPAAVIVTHLYGQMAAIESIAALCHDAGVPLIEDCAQSHGASIEGRQAGAWSDIACFSFYPTKNLGAVGDAGCVVTPHANLARGVKTLRQYGWASKYTIAQPHGRNSRMDELQAAVLRAKLPSLNEHNAMRKNIAAHYAQSLQGLPLLCPSGTGTDFVAHLYVIRTDARDALKTYLQSCGIASDIHYPIPDHFQPAYGIKDSYPSLKITEQTSAQVLSLPCYPGMSAEALDRVAYAVHGFFS